MKAMRPAFVVLAALLCWSVLAAPIAAADIYRLLTKVKGEVQSRVRGETGWRDVLASRRLGAGDSARTKIESIGQIRTDIGVAMRLGPNTTLTMEQFDLEAAKVKVESGGVRSSIYGLFKKPQKFEVETPNAVLAARGTDFGVMYTGEPKGEGRGPIGPVASLPGVDAELLAAAAPPDGSTVVEVFDGTVDATGRGPAAGPPESIGAGGAAIIYPDGSMEVFVDGRGLLPDALRPGPGELPEPPEHGSYTEGSPPPAFGSSIVGDAVTSILLPSTSGGTGTIEVEINFGPSQP